MDWDTRITERQTEQTHRRGKSDVWMGWLYKIVRQCGMAREQKDGNGKIWDGFGIETARVGRKLGWDGCEWMWRPSGMNAERNTSAKRKKMHMKCREW